VFRRGRHAYTGSQGLRNLLVVTAVAAMLGALVGSVLPVEKSNRSTSHGVVVSSRERRPHAGKAEPATFLGPYGVEARWVIQQNKLPGTTRWKIPPADAGGIAGYASTQQARLGQQVTLYVSTKASSFHVDAFRMGYYQGKGARLIWKSKEIAGVSQPTCPVVPNIFMVQCNWSPSLRIKITRLWVQGQYLLKLVGSGGQQSYIPLTIWDPSSHAAYVVMAAVLTWQAFNPYGGYDLYGGGPPGLTGYPPPDRSRVLSFDRPYAYGDGAASFLGNEYPLIRFVEKHGLDVTYWTNITLATHGNLLMNHKALLSLGHDEEWSLRMREWATKARNAGVNLVFFGASPVLRKVRLQPSPLGANMEEVNYRDPQADPLYGKDNAEVTQNWWGQPPANDPASTLVGATYVGYNNSTAANMVVVDSSSFIFKGTHLHNGSIIPSVLKFDFDAYDPSRPNPPGVEILTHSPVVISFSGKSAYADTTYYTWPASKAGVFESGTNYWIASMQSCPSATTACPAPILRRITGNVLRAFGRGPAGIKHPSIANWHQFY